MGVGKAAVVWSKEGQSKDARVDVLGSLGRGQGQRRVGNIEARLGGGWGGRKPRSAVSGSILSSDSMAAFLARTALMAPTEPSVAAAARGLTPNCS
jgi:hypothetical protein